MALEEEIVETDDIQGNILAGFNKDYQVFLFLKMAADGGAVPATRRWLRWLAPQVSSVTEVLGFNSLFRALRRRQGGDPHGIVATWLNVAFSAAALRQLSTAAAVDQFVDDYFKDGLAAHAGALNDPVSPAEGSPETWVVGGPNNEADIVLIIASDSPAFLAERLAVVRAALPPQLTVVWEQPGQTLPKPLTGHEHFGFKDGISQPGVRGRTPTEPPQFLTPRLIDPSKTPQADALLPEFAAPGQPLVWPGQFVFGYRRQSHNDARNPPPGPQGLATACPPWGRNGSYLVIRRLRQDVPAFRAFVRQTAEALRSQPGFSGLTATRFASMCVGRWPSGAPIMRTPQADNSDLGADDYANNFFRFAGNSPPAQPLLPSARYAGDTFPTSERDDRGITCPFSSHVRKVNPRDTTTEQGNTQDVLARMILRRGIPFGPAYPGDLEQDGAVAPADTQAERGLVFVSYQTSIHDQFAFLQANWANDPYAPNSGGGQDPIIGQGDRLAGGVRGFAVRAAGQPERELALPKDWVIPTGGGCFFSPSISALTEVLGHDP